MASTPSLRLVSTESWPIGVGRDRFQRAAQIVGRSTSRSAGEIGDRRIWRCPGGRDRPGDGCSPTSARARSSWSLHRVAVSSLNCSISADGVGRLLRRAVRLAGSAAASAAAGSASGGCLIFRIDDSFRIDDLRLRIDRPLGRLRGRLGRRLPDPEPVSARRGLASRGVSAVSASGFGLRAGSESWICSCCLGVALFVSTADGRPPWRCSRPSGRCGHSSAGSGR